MLKLAGECIEGQMADHIARLDAHTKNIYEVLRTGEYLAHPLGTRWSQVNVVVANTLYGSLFLVSRDITVDRIAISVQSLSAGNCRLGIYNVGTNLYPGTLLLDAGTVATGATGLKTIVINQSLPKGIYFVALVCDATPTLYGTNATYPPVISPLGLQSTDINAVYQGWSVAFTYAALPTPFTAGGALATVKHYIALRLASLD